MVPLAAHTLPHAGFGAWLLLSTIPALIGFLDLGLANGLVTIVATESPSRQQGQIPTGTSRGPRFCCSASG